MLFTRITILALLMLPLQLQADSQWEDHSRIIQSATDFLESLPPVDTNQTRVEIKPGQLDPRLKLPTCHLPLESSQLGNQRQMGRVIVEVRCNDEKPWKLRIPFMVSVFVPVAIASKPISRKQHLSRSDIMFEDRDISKLNRGYYSTIDNILGRVTRNQIRTGIVINPGQIRPPYLVLRGQTVKIVVRTPSYQVTMNGQALSDGAKGEVIKVKNSKSQKIVEGVVTARGIVQVSH
jgi:flagella basal body P-ring formation protein FlgA